jgi:dephospho-CoA kinase
VRVVGLTGGIGSGKSALASAFARLGCPVIDADVIARRCVAPGSAGLAAVIEHFGPAVLQDDGTLDRSRLASIVFGDDEARGALESIVHPCIEATIAAELVALRGRRDAPEVVIVEHPLLVETGPHAWVDMVVVVEAPEDVRLSRLVEGRGMTATDARARIAAQADDAARRAVADHVVVNDGEVAALAPHARRLLLIAAAGTALSGPDIGSGVTR